MQDRERPCHAQGTTAYQEKGPDPNGTNTCECDKKRDKKKHHTTICCTTVRCDYSIGFVRPACIHTVDDEQTDNASRLKRDAPGGPHPDPVPPHIHITTHATTAPAAHLPPSTVPAPPAPYSSPRLRSYSSMSPPKEARPALAAYSHAGRLQAVEVLVAPGGRAVSVVEVVTVSSPPDPETRTTMTPAVSAGQGHRGAGSCPSPGRTARLGRYRTRS